MSAASVAIPRQPGLFCLVLVLGIVSAPPLAPGQPLSPPGAFVGNAPLVLPAERHDTSPPLSEMAGQENREAAPVFRELPRHPLPRRGPKPPGPDPLAQSVPGALAGPAPRASFDGVGNVDAVLPPDPNGAVGPSHYVQWVNLSFAVYDKAGNLLLGPVAGNALWLGFGGPCETSNDGDPIVLYDHLADRWVMSQFALPGGSQGYWQCIAVSSTADPTGTYNRYAFRWSDTKLNDYPKLGVWPDGYYMSVNQFTCSLLGCAWAGQGVAAFERDQMLVGNPAARMVAFDLYATDPNLGGMLPSSLDGPAPAGLPNYFVQVDDDAWGYSPDQLQIWEFHVDWSSLSSSTFTRRGTLPTAPFDSNMCGYATSCIPQRGTSRKVDAIADRLMYRLQFRSFGDHHSLVVNHTVDVDGTDHAGVRWYELRDDGTGWTIRQGGTYAPDGDHRWMGSIAMDQAGNIALGFSVAGKSTYPSIRYTGRLAADPPGQMTLAETSIVAGGGSQTYRVGRWGDYSSLAVDPDGCTFWYTQEYYAATSSTGWKTRIASFALPGCGGGSAPSADLAIAKTDSPDPVQVDQVLTYTITVTNDGPDPATGVVVTDPLDSTLALLSATSTQGSCSGTGTISCGLGDLASGDSATVTIAVTPGSPGVISNTATVGATSPSDPNPTNNSATATTVVSPPPGSAPVVSTCNPSSGSQNQQLVVAVTGSNFQSGASVSFGDRIMVQGVTFVSSTQLNVQIKIHPKAASGPRDVTVTDPDGQSGTGPACFSVN